jgi:hypothetical protein
MYIPVFLNFLPCLGFAQYVMQKPFKSSLNYDTAAAPPTISEISLVMAA